MKETSVMTARVNREPRSVMAAEDGDCGGFTANIPVAELVVAGIPHRCAVVDLNQFLS